MGDGRAIWITLYCLAGLVVGIVHRVKTKEAIPLGEYLAWSVMGVPIAFTWLLQAKI